MSTIVTLNDAAFARLLAYTGHYADRLLRAIPSLTPVTFTRPGEPPALRVASLHDRMLDCPQCRLRRGGAFLDTRLFPLKMACLRHGYWLYRDGSGRRLPAAVFPEIAAAQKRLTRLVARRGADAAMRAYGLARRYFQDEWCWRAVVLVQHAGRALVPALGDGPASRKNPLAAVLDTSPGVRPLAAIFASPFWAALAVPAPDRRHRRFYQHLLTVLGIDGARDYVPSIRNFDPLPDAIREQASMGRLLSDPKWGTYTDDSRTGLIPFIDITDHYERSRRIGTQAIPQTPMVNKL
jgi:hypothetical protein